MPELTVTVRVPMPKHPSLGALETSIFTELQAAGRELLTQAFSVIEPEVLTGARQRRRRRYLITRFGQIRFHRWQTRTEEGYGCPLDEALGLAAGDPCSAWVHQTAAWLAQAPQGSVRRPRSGAEKKERRSPGRPCDCQSSDATAFARRALLKPHDSPSPKATDPDARWFGMVTFPRFDREGGGRSRRVGSPSLVPEAGTRCAE